MTPTRPDQWDAAVRALDASEVPVRAIIESDLMNVAGVPGIRYGEAVRGIHATLRKVAVVRVNAFKESFRTLRETAPKNDIGGVSYARWAKYFVNDEVGRIDTALKTGLMRGFDSLILARMVVGSAGVNGIDGVTEVTRQKIRNLEHAEAISLKAKEE